MTLLQHTETEEPELKKDAPKKDGKICCRTRFLIVIFVGVKNSYKYAFFSFSRKVSTTAESSKIPFFEINQRKRKEKEKKKKRIII